MRIGPFDVPRMFLVHASAVLLAIVLVTTLIRGAVMGDTINACSARMNNGTIYGLETRAGLVSPGELQAGLAGRDYGVMENLDIVRFDSAPSKTGLRVRLASLDSKSSSDASVDNGIDFGWLPKKMPSSRVACLSYNLRLPADFKPADGGRLPSFVGAPNDSASDLRTIGANLMWAPNGSLMIDVKAEAADDGSLSATAVNSDDAIKLGVWVRIDQEVILNTPGKDDGEVRVWVDGVLRLKRDTLLFRRNDRTFFNGVAVTVAYTGDKGDAASGATAIEVSPFEIRWP
jgi:hypothetical protein